MHHGDFEATIEWLHWRWRRTNKPFLEDEARWTIPVSIIGVFFVIIGVAGEGFCEAKQATAETAVRQYDEGKLAEALIQAGKAKDSADAAAVDATTAKGNAESAAKVASSALAAEGALERENAALKAKMAPRRVTGKQAAKFAEVCHVTGVPKISVIGMLAVPDADDFADDIAHRLADCGFNVTLTKSMMVIPGIGGGVRGVVLYVGSNRQVNADIIKSAMTHAEITPNPIVFLPGEEANNLTLIIGMKP